MQKIILLATLLMFAFSGFGQECLLIKHNRRDKIISYCIGDEIRVLDKNLQKKYSGTILSLRDSVLVLERPVENAKKLRLLQKTYRDYIAISDIEAVYEGKKGILRSVRYFYSGTAMIGGGLIIGTNSVNSLLEGDTPSYQKMIVATGILISGFIVRHLGRDKYKIGKNWTIKTGQPEVPASEEIEPNLREKAN